MTDVWDGQQHSVGDEGDAAPGRPTASAATKQHHYRIKVWGYVFPQLPPGSSPEAIKAAVEKAVWEDGDLDITGTTVEAEFDD